jgi:manganese-dependent inorganic pyrophosphatase
MNNSIIVTGYESPDLDGVACAVGYAEFLSKKGKEAIAVTFGNLQREAEFVLRTTNSIFPPKGEELLENDTPVILVDASDLVGISKKIDPQQVIEIFDHRMINDAEKFSNATKHIEAVGSCATLIADRFFAEDIPISEGAAIALYAAIISNTINFNASVTTDRDRKMAAWLNEKASVPANFIHSMFAYKSQITKPLKDVFDQTIAHFIFNNQKIVIVQIELIDAENFVRNNLKEISRVLEVYKHAENADFVFLTSIDVEKGGNIFVVTDDETKVLLEKALVVSFMGYIAKRSGIIMRKTITPILKQLLEQN